MNRGLDDAPKLVRNFCWKYAANWFQSFSILWILLVPIRPLKCSANVACPVHLFLLMYFLWTKMTTNYTTLYIQATPISLHNASTTCTFDILRWRSMHESVYNIMSWESQHRSTVCLNKFWTKYCFVITTITTGKFRWKYLQQYCHQLHTHKV